MNSVVNSAARRATHALLGSRRWIRRELVAVASNLTPGSALEIGSGKPHNGTYPYSQLDVLPPGWRLEHSDANASFGHRVVDLTAPPAGESFDLVICNSVLEHIGDTAAAVAGLRALTRPGGTAMAAVPSVYPLHDEPNDYWRFTEWGLRRLFENFEDVEVRRRGPRRLPVSLLVVAHRGAS